MERLIIFGILCLAVIIISRRNLLNAKSHGFYRLFSWIGISWLFADNYRLWFDRPFSINQIFSWILLFISLYLVVAGVILLIKTGKPSKNREDKTLLSFEKTTGLIDTGVYRYIRHPLYASLIFLTWGIFFKNPILTDLIVAMLSTVFLYITSKYDEKECIQYFGEEYKSYMKRSKMFVPFIF